MARKHTLRVGIGTPEEPYVPGWTFTSSKNDVYLSSRINHGTFKLSLHGSGVWVAAFSTESGVEIEGNRRAHRWRRPTEEFAPGYVLGPSIMIPRIDKRHDLPFTLEPTRKKTTWLPAPKIRHELQLVTMFEAKPDATNFVEETAIEIMGPLPMANGESFWVVAHELPLDRDGTRNYLDLRDGAVGIGGVKITGGPPAAGRQAMVVNRIGDGRDGRPVITEIPLGSHNYTRVEAINMPSPVDGVPQR